MKKTKTIKWFCTNCGQLLKNASDKDACGNKTNPATFGMYCKNCERPMRKYDTKCMWCGTEYAREETWMGEIDKKTARTEKKHKIGMTLLLVGVVVFFVAIITIGAMGKL